MKKLLLILSAALFSAGICAQTKLYVRGADSGWGAQTTDEYAATSNDGGTTYVWDWSSSPKTFTGEFKLAAIVDDGAWDNNLNFGPSGSNMPIVFSNGSFTAAVINDGGSKNFTMPSQGATITISKITLNTSTLNVIIEGSDGEIVDPATVPLFIRGDLNTWLDEYNEQPVENIPVEWKGVKQADANVYIWDWSAAPKDIEGTFKFGDAQWKVHNYGALIPENPVVIGDAASVSKDSGAGNFSTGEAILQNVSKITLDLDNNTLLLETGTASAVEETAEVAISAANGLISADGEMVIYDLIGNDVTAQNGNLKGNYIVVVNGNAQKVNVQ